ncbi:MAG: hypothetical protein ABI697_05325 [Devosia sp.]
MQHEFIPRATPSARPISMEIDGEPLGVVVPSAEGVRFLAVRLSAFALDGLLFDSIEAAQAALDAAIHGPSGNAP